MSFSSLGIRASLFSILICLVAGYPLSPEGGVLPLKPDDTVDCPDVIWENQTAGHFYSPNYPNNYSASAYCSYKIEGPVGSKIVLAFYVFETEPTFDVVTLYDGEDTTSRQIIALSGESVSTNVYNTSGNVMTIVFQSDEFDNRLGFYAGFIATNGIIEYPTGLICPDSTYKDALGVIVSPHYPAQYPPSADCEYLIGNGNEDTYVLFTIDRFNTEGEYDYLEVYDGQDGSSSLIIQLSGTAVEGTHYSSSGPYAFARFITDAFNQESGFSITYQILKKGSSTPLTPIEVLKKKINNPF